MWRYSIDKYRKDVTLYDRCINNTHGGFASLAVFDGMFYRSYFNMVERKII